MKSYLIIESGLLERQIFLIKDSVTIGRSSSNTIRLTHPGVSRKHSRLYLLNDGSVVIEDLNSHNGTFLNGERISKAMLSHGDIVRIGNVTFRFYQETEEDVDELQETQELLVETHGSPIFAPPETTRRSKRLKEAITRVSLFDGLDERGMEELLKKGKLRIYEAGSIIVRQGDRADSLFVILDGKVRLITHGEGGKLINLAYLKENEIFGEISYFTRSPRNFTAQAVEECLLWELGHDVLDALIQRSLSIEARLKAHYEGRLADIEAKKRAAGLVERRKAPRLNVEIPVLVTPVTAGDSHGQPPATYSCISTNISVTGVGVRCTDTSLRDLSIGCTMDMEIQLPAPWNSIPCTGTLRNIFEHDGVLNLGIEFTRISTEAQSCIKDFISLK
jgi:CRP-like cAMP-binding protein